MWWKTPLYACFVKLMCKLALKNNFCSCKAYNTVMRRNLTLTLYIEQYMQR